MLIRLTHSSPVCARGSLLESVQLNTCRNSICAPKLIFTQFKILVGISQFFGRNGARLGRERSQLRQSGGGYVRGGYVCFLWRLLVKKYTPMPPYSTNLLSIATMKSPINVLYSIRKWCTLPEVEKYVATINSALTISFNFQICLLENYIGRK